MREIVLRDGEVCRVDAADYPLVSGQQWRRNGWGYAEAGSKRAVLMHRLIVSAPPGMVVHHRNGDKLDNRKANLEIVGRKEHGSLHRGPDYQRGHLDRLGQRTVNIAVSPETRRLARQLAVRMEVRLFQAVHAALEEAIAELERVHPE